MNEKLSQLNSYFCAGTPPAEPYDTALHYFAVFMVTAVFSMAEMGAKMGEARLMGTR